MPTASSYKPRLSVLVCTFGEDGIRRVAEADYPVVEGVEYCVSWQLPEGDPIIPDELRRSDIRIEISHSRGLSHNRNLSLKMARGEYSLISDDDVRYVPEYFDNLFQAFEEWPDADLLTFTYESSGFPKSYPDYTFDFHRRARFYFVTSFEMAFRTSSVAGHLKFDENFGIGARWPSGEEDLFVHDALKMGLNLRFVPYPIGRHDGSTTSDRVSATTLFAETKGAVFRILYPFSWPLRLLSHIPRRDKRISVCAFIKAWIHGALTSKRNL